jgi:RecB family endonuclease NucS
MRWQKMLKTKPVFLREREELEPSLIANPDAIEPGLKVITHQLMTDSDPLDILAVDDNSALVRVPSDFLWKGQIFELTQQLKPRF